MNEIYQEHRRLARFGIVGLVNNLTLYVGYLLLLNIAVQPLWAAVACYCIGICTSYYFNRSWSFESRDVHGEDLSKFLIAHAVGICSTILVLSLLLTWLRPDVAQLLNVLFTALINYKMLSLLGFGSPRAR